MDATARVHRGPGKRTSVALGDAGTADEGLVRGYLSPTSATTFSVALFDAFRLKLNDHDLGTMSVFVAAISSAHLPHAC